MKGWAHVIAAGTALGFEFWGLHQMSIYREGVLIAEDVGLSEARQIVLRAIRSNEVSR